MVYDRKGQSIWIIYLLISIIVWVLSLGGLLFRRKSIILCYHDMTVNNVSAFRQQMNTLRHRVVTLDYRSKFLLRPSVILTFDDAFENVIDNVIPVIEELNLPISIYVVTADSGTTPKWLKDSGHDDEYKLLMSREQIKNLANHPLISFGIHTHTHPQLTQLDPHEITQELTQSKQLLEAWIRQPITALAFPHGAFNGRVSAITKACGLTQLLTLEEKMLPVQQVQGEMGRFLMDVNVWSLEFRLTIDGAYCWLFYFRNLMRLIKRS